MRTRTLTILASLVLILSALGAASAGLKIKTARIAGNTVETDSVIGADSPPIKYYTWVFTVGTNATTDTAAIWNAAAWGNVLAAGEVDSVVTLGSVWAWDEVGAVLSAAGADSISGGVHDLYDDYSHNIYAYNTQTRANYKFPTYAKRNSRTLLYLPVENYLPARSTIVQAWIGLTGGARNQSWWGTQTGGVAQDTLRVTLDTLSADRHWITGPNTGTTTAKFIGCRAASWKNQIQPVHHTPAADSSYVNQRAGYPGVVAGVLRLPGSGASAFDGAAIADSYAWSPPLAERYRTIDWGPTSYGLVPTADATSDTVSLHDMKIDCTRPVQYLVNGAQNSGFWLHLISAQTSRNNTITPYYAGVNPYRRPFIVVRWSNQPARGGPWGGKEVAFTFMSDDGKADANNAWTSELNDRGYSMTIAATQTFIEAPVSGTCTYNDLVRWHNEGHEIASHSRLHPATIGLWTYTNTAAGYDSLVTDMEPAWLDSGMALATGARGDSAYYAADRYVGKTFALPLNTYRLSTVRVADSLGYLALRCSQIGVTFPLRAPTPGDTSGASIDAGGDAVASRRIYGLSSPYKTNILLAPYIWTDVVLYGGVAAPVTDMTALKRNIRLCIEDQAVRGMNGHWIVFSHNLISNPYTYTGGINLDQLQATLDAIEEAGNVRVLNLSDAARVWRTRWALIDHPDPWGTAAAWETQLVAPRQVWGQKRPPNYPAGW